MARRLKFLILIFLLMPMFLSGAYSSANKPLRVGSEPDYPPYCQINEAGEPEGFSIDLFGASMKEVKLEYDYKTGLWEEIKEELAQGQLDALPLMGRTPEREPYFDFTFPYISLHGAVFVRNGDNSIKSRGDLADKELIFYLRQA